MEFLKTEAGIRLGGFIGVFLAMAVWELLSPRRILRTGKPLRWGSNLGLVFLNSILLRLMVPLGAVGVALFAVQSHLVGSLTGNVSRPTAGRSYGDDRRFDRRPRYTDCSSAASHAPVSDHRTRRQLPAQ